MRHRRRSTSSLPGLLAVVVGASLIIGTPLFWSSGPPTASAPADVNAGAAVSLAAPAPATSVGAATTRSSATPPASAPATSWRPDPMPATATRTSTPSTPARSTPTRSTTTRSTTTRTTSARTTPATTPTRRADQVPVLPRPVLPSPPVRLRMPALGLDVPVIPVGVDGRGELAIPEDVDTAGWFAAGPAAGAPSGSVVIAGHVDSARLGIGAFKALWSAVPGILVRVDREAGPALTYRVVSRERFDKRTVPLAALFGTAGAPRLTLITCGGAFDDETLSYTENVVVTAVPV